MAGGSFQNSPARLIALVTPHRAAFIAEIVRAGIAADMPRGQTEAAYSLGLSRRASLRLILIPQALRVIIPPPQQANT